MTQFSDYQNYIYVSKYARYLDLEKRRETWEETVDRYINFFREKIKNSPIDESKKKELLEVLG